MAKSTRPALTGHFFTHLPNGNEYVTIDLSKGGFNVIVKHYITEEGESPLEKWLKKNRAAMAKVMTATQRLTDGNLSSVKWLSGRPGIGEYRVNWGAGLRIYLMQEGNEIIILLCAGFKDSQDNDLKRAEQFRAEYLKRGKKDASNRKH
ncbi:type II toxin-antitoxin system RelE/ParE family toxin [Yokenella regensburgei]|uniref:type II toxin-antitoxin system RelE/ParE family toxin n=1 Tax=Yokenella regensburgei TaxID=158877 RepID=UPI003EDB5E68